MIVFEKFEFSLILVCKFYKVNPLFFEYLLLFFFVILGLKGEIKLFHFIPGKTYIVDSFEFLDSLVGASFNTGFGTTIVGADLDGDGYDELLAGEPYYTVQ